MGQSGKVLSKQYLQALQSYLSSTSKLPINADGTINVTKLAEEASVPRQSLYKNPKMKAALEEARKVHGVLKRAEVQSTSTKASRKKDKKLSLKADKQGRALERRVEKLEQQNAVLVAENSDLRKKLANLRQQLGREDMTIETGRRIPVPFDHA
ncbi:DUF6262 family protein [Halodesulfovibrio sp.]|uniref:DUF6262 family protein n=1 Tax=Halodesulfovibrio sp. TaxID=1912772 RepID=UPI0025C4004A|nr:DUF6262 family protein [Halodesulfovibrio sp.]